MKYALSLHFCQLSLVVFHYITLNFIQVEPDYYVTFIQPDNLKFHQTSFTLGRSMSVFSQGGNILLFKQVTFFSCHKTVIFIHLCSWCMAHVYARAMIYGSSYTI